MFEIIGGGIRGMMSAFLRRGGSLSREHLDRTSARTQRHIVIFCGRDFPLRSTRPYVHSKECSGLSGHG